MNSIKCQREIEVASLNKNYINYDYVPYNCNKILLGIYDFPNYLDESILDFLVVGENEFP